VVRDAVPTLRAAVPSKMLPSRNCTVPVAEFGAMVALKTTAAPRGAGFLLEVRVTLVDALVTVSLSAGDEPVAVFKSPV
jgi:hypothetical protein